MCCRTWVPRPLLLWPGSLQASQCCRTVQWWRWGTCWRWWVLRGSGRSAPGNGPGSSYPHTPPSQGPRLEPGAGCQIAAAHTDQRTVLWGRRPCYLFSYCRRSSCSTREWSNDLSPGCHCFWRRSSRTQSAWVRWVRRWASLWAPALLELLQTPARPPQQVVIRQHRNMDKRHWVKQWQQRKQKTACSRIWTKQ